MSFRPEQIFIGRDTKSRLHKVIRIGRAQAEAVLPGSLPQDLCGTEGRIMTPDELADNFINKMIAMEYPEVLDLERELKDAEKKFTDQLAALDKALQATEEKFLADQAKGGKKKK